MVNNDMILDLTEKYGKAVCALLWARFAYLAAKKKPLLFLILLAMHATEYKLKGKEIAQKNGMTEAEGLANCLAFGFTWWLPLEKRSKKTN